MPENGLTTLPSSHGAKDTMDRLEAEVKAKGLTVFARVDHATGAKEAGMQLRPTELLIFGNARGGTPLMQALQTTGIDLPLKALVWEDPGGKVWLSYNEPAWIAQRHASLSGDAASVSEVTSRLAGALAALAKAATS